MSNEFFVKFRTFDKNGNNVEATFDFVERIVRFVAIDHVASTLSLRQCCFDIYTDVDGSSLHLIAPSDLCASDTVY